MANHSILSINFSNTTPWYKDYRSIFMTALLLINENNKVSVQVDIIPAGEEERKTLLPQTIYTNVSKKEYGIEFSELNIGSNMIIVTFKDETPPENETGETIFQHEIVLEDRDSFNIKREFCFEDEYYTTGALTIDPVNGMQLKTTTGLEEGIAVVVNAINMDGRAKIKSITVNGDQDKLGDVDAVRTAEYREDRGDSILQTLALSDLRTFNAISKIQVIDNG